MSDYSYAQWPKQWPERGTLPLEKFVPWDKNPPQRRTLSDRRLERSISDRGILVDVLVVAIKPLGSTLNEPALMVVEGNRRLRIAQRMGLPKLSYRRFKPREKEHFTEQELLAAVIDINLAQDKWTMQALAQLGRDAPEAMEFIPEKTRSTIVRAQKTLAGGYDGFIEQYALSAIDVGARVAEYLKVPDTHLKTRKDIVYWIAKHKQTRRALSAVLMRVSSKKLWEAIEDDKPLELGGYS